MILSNSAKQTVSVDSIGPEDGRRRPVHMPIQDKVPFPFQLQAEIAKLADPKAQIAPTYDQQEIRRRIEQLHELEL